MMPNPVRVSTVESVTFHEEEQDVYDLTIPGPHTYVVEGLMSHNTAVGSTQMLLNMSMYENTALVALEMDEKEMTARILSNLGGVKVHKFAAKSLTEREQLKCTEAYKKAVRDRQKLGTRYSIFSPDADVTLEESLYGLLPFGYRVFLIDYISLLKGVDGDDAWQALGRVARFAKVFARIHNVVVILLAQLNDEGKIRYAKSIIEHSNIAWFWTYTEQSRESGILDILPVKARNQDPKPIQLWHDFSVMQVRDTAPDEYEKAMKDDNFKRNRQEQEDYVGEAVRQAQKGSGYRYSMEDEIPV